MENARFGKPACSQSEGTGPRERALASAANCMSPMPKDPLPEDAEAVEVSRYRIVVKVARLSLDHHRTSRCDLSH